MSDEEWHDYVLLMHWRCCSSWGEGEDLGVQTKGRVSILANVELRTVPNCISMDYNEALTIYCILYWHVVADCVCVLFNVHDQV